MDMVSVILVAFFFVNDTATTEIYTYRHTLSRHDALPISGNLWLSVGIHTGVIIGEDLVFSVPDSGVTYTGHLLAARLTGPAWLRGGDAGPEGSVLALPVFTALLLVLRFIYRRAEEHKSELQSLMRISYAVSCLKKK